MLGLNKAIYEKTAADGHFGRTPEIDGAFSWENTDKTTVFTKQFLLNNQKTLLYCNKFLISKMGFGPFFFGDY